MRVILVGCGPVPNAKQFKYPSRRWDTVYNTWLERNTQRRRARANEERHEMGDEGTIICLIWNEGKGGEGEEELGYQEVCE